MSTAKRLDKGRRIGSEDKERQLKLLLDYFREVDDRYERVDPEVASPDGAGKCNLTLTNEMPVEAKLIRF